MDFSWFFMKFNACFCHYSGGCIVMMMTYPAVCSAFGRMFSIYLKKNCASGILHSSPYPANTILQHLMSSIMTQGPIFSMNRTKICFRPQAFAKVTYHGFFKCEGKCYPNTQLELCWKILSLTIFL